MTRALMLSVLLAAVVSATAAEPEEKRTPLPLGERVPDFTLPDGAGRLRQLRDLTGGKLAVLLFTGGSAPRENLSDAATKLEPLGSVLVTVATASPRFPTLYDGGGAVTRRFTTRPPTAFLIDGDGILRGFTDASSPDAVVSLVEQWTAGRRAFLSACIRCHEDESYPRLKALHGIGNRLTQEQILERMFPVPLGQEHISIRSHVFRRGEVDALLRYVAGL
jgi:hypothetical protein